MDQLKNAWRLYEGDAWFERNRNIISEIYNAGEGNDPVISVLEKYNMIFTHKVLEIGSSSGYRLHNIKEKYPECELYGIDPSSKAIEFGKTNYPKINLRIGTADELPFENGMFDIVIVGFVFYTIDRELLFQSIAEIDRVLKNTGYLIIVDFFSARTLKNHYAHISEFQAYAFKQRYEDIFISSQLYHLIDKSTFYHGSQGENTDKKYGNDVMSDFDNLFNVILLKKSIHAAYK
jgi:ubiquinone/menaquinone biosynthesis C-methylase UbiE